MTSQTNNSDSIPNEELEKIISKCIKDNYHIFKAFDVADGNINMKEYFKDVSKRREDEQDG